MGYYSFYRMFKDIIKTIFGNKTWRFILILLIIFVIFFIVDKKSSYGFSIDDFTYLDMTNEQIQACYDFVQEHKGDYDSFLCGYYSANYEKRFRFVFYNQDTTSSLYLTTVSGNPYFNYIIPITSSGLDYYVVKEGEFDNIITHSTNVTSISIGIRSYNDLNSQGYSDPQYNCIASNRDIYTDSTLQNIWFTGSNVSLVELNPFFYNKSNFINFSADSLLVYPNDYGISDTLYLHFLTVDNTVTDDSHTYYYYSQRIFALNNSSQYLNSANGVFYYNIPRSVFALEANKQYLFFLSDEDNSINYTVGFYDVSNDFDGFSLTPTDSQIPASTTIIDNQQNQNNQLDNINNFLNNDTVSDSTNNDIDNALQFDTSNNATSFVTSFFSNLSDLFVGLSDYDLNEVTIIDLPIPFTNSTLSLRSDLLSSHLDVNFIQIITLFWYFLFGMYYIKFMISISKSITTGDAIVGTVKVPEVITDDVL